MKLKVLLMLVLGFILVGCSPKSIEQPTASTQVDQVQPEGLETMESDGSEAIAPEDDTTDLFGEETEINL